MQELKILLAFISFFLAMQNFAMGKKELEVYWLTVMVYWLVNYAS